MNKSLLALLFFYLFMTDQINAKINRKDLDLTISNISKSLFEKTTKDGHFQAFYESDPSLDASVLLLLNRLNRTDKKLEKLILHRIWNWTGYDGTAWAAYHQGPRNIDITALIVFALEKCQISDPRKDKAKIWLEQNLKENKLNSITSFFLSAFGDPKAKLQLPPLNLKLLAVGPKHPLSIFNFGIMKLLLIPYLLQDHFTNGQRSNRAFVRKYNLRPLEKGAPFLPFIEKTFFNLRLFNFLKSKKRMKNALNLYQKFIKVDDETIAHWGLNYILDRQQSNHAWYTTTTTIFNLLALDSAHKAGVANFSKEIELGLAGLNHYTLTKGVQPTTSYPWETSYALKALNEVDSSVLKPYKEKYKMAADWLLKIQVIEQKGDWSYLNPSNIPGGWSFVVEDKYHVDIDDTAAALAALIKHPYIHSHFLANSQIKIGLNWLLKMQNKDGGFAAWDKGISKAIERLSHVLFSGNTASVDLSQIDISARVLKTLNIARLKMPTHAHKIKSAIMNVCHFLNKNSSYKVNGAHVWFGEYYTNYLSGTAEALEAMATADCINKEKLENSLGWMLSLQNQDGGFGEHPSSYKEQKYVWAKSTKSQTALVANSLISVMMSGVLKNSKLNQKLKPSLDKTISYLLNATKNGTFLEEKQHLASYVRDYQFARYELFPYHLPLKAIARYKKNHFRK